MAGSLGTAILELTATNAALVAKLDESEALTNAKMAQTEGVVSSHAKLIGAAIAGAFAVDKMVEFFSEAVSGAARLQKSQEVIDSTFGKSSGVVKAFGDSAAASFGVSAGAADATSAKFGILFQNMGVGQKAAATMTVGWEQLAGSLSRIKGVDPSDVMNKMTLAAEGNTRGLKELGITITPVAEKQQALADGFGSSVGKLDAAQKATVIYQLATKDLATDLDLAKQHSGDFANEQATLGANMSNLKDKIGAELLPALSSMTGGLNDAVNWLTNGASATQHLQDVMSALGISAGTQAKIIDGIKTAVQGLQTAFDAVKPVALDAAKTAFDGLKTAADGLLTAASAVFGFIESHQTAFEILGAAVGGAAAAMAAMAIVEGAWTVATTVAYGGIQLLTGAMAILDAVMAANPFVLAVVALAALGAALVVAYEKVGWFHDFVNTAFHDVQAVISAVVGAVEGLWASWGSTITSVASSAWGSLSRIVGDAITVVKGVISVFIDVFHGDWGKAWSDMGTVVKAAWDLVVTYFKAPILVIEALVKGIGPAIASALDPAIKTIEEKGLQIALALVEPFSHLPGFLGGGWARDLKSSMEGTLNDLQTVTVAHLTDLAGAAGSAATAIGHDIADGIQQGIIAHAAGAAAAAAAMVFSALGAARAAAKTGSASKETMALGSDFGQGFIIGIFNEQGAAGTAGEGLANAALGGLRTSLANVDDLSSHFAQPVAMGLVKAAYAPEIAAAAAKLGPAAEQAILNGLLPPVQTFGEKLAAANTAAITAANQAAVQKIQQAQSDFSSAFGTLASNSVAAFNAGMTGWVSPAQKILNTMQLADQTKQYADAVKNALTAIGADKTAILAAQAAGDLAAQKTAEAQLQTDQASYQAAVRAQQEFHLQQAAAAQATAHAADEKAQAASLAKMLGQLQGSLPAQLAEWAKTHADVLQDGANFDADSFLQHDTYLSGLLEKVKASLADHPGVWKSTYGDILTAVKGYAGQLQDAGASNADAHKTGVAGKHDDIVGEWTSVMNGSHDAVGAFESQFFEAGQSIGNQLAAGLESVAGKAAAAAGKIASDISAFFPHSPAKRGPLMRLPDWTAWVTGGLTPGLADGHAARVAAGVASSATSGAGGGITIPVYLDGKKIAESTRKHLTLAGGRNGIQIVGNA